MGSDNIKKVSIVVPVYNNEGSLIETCAQLHDEHKKSFNQYDFEIVFVDDGSKDDSWKVLQELRKQYDDIKIVKLSRNFGQASANLAGFNFTDGDVVVTISADLQDPITLIPEMLNKWEAGCEIVAATRKSRADGFLSSILSRIAYKIARSANPNIPKGGFDFYLVSRRAKDLLLSFKGRHHFFQGEIMWLGFPTAIIPYERKERKHGKSGWTLTKRISLFIDLILDSTTLPLRAMSIIGAGLALLGYLYAFAIFVSWLFGETPYLGWAAIMVTILGVGGQILLMLGIIGEYVLRIHESSRERPKFIVQDSE
ncbi:glycosyltransferase family 2 protein [Maridesulfovibrio salexigens]|uniref:Glycosyl transferase family 2 n=1 Tax=Maridesulfovibrio salexigens (strain ATCC 14822 / DSM 2638 / NCIMB 8403 / VKM B-1763) TaxID=526222 RepID=C6BTH4_MARSD|nr:glycosyltransferase family 2 protein [Maridesulfovibrio salexigens]ACS81655.1 glycosyl transferase family 2 [Maridesulfovibrio salexigens DSM 2638]